MYKASTIYYTLSQVEIEILSFVFFFFPQSTRFNFCTPLGALSLICPYDLSFLTASNLSITIYVYDWDCIDSIDQFVGIYFFTKLYFS